MEPSFYSEQIERMQPQLAAEKDPATRREMKRTLHHLHKEYRKATRHHEPWRGLKRHLIVLVSAFFAIVLFCVYLENTYGWQNASTAFAVGVGVLLLVTVTIFFAMKRISPETYSALVNTAMGSLPWMGGRNGGSSEQPKQIGPSPDKVIEGRTGTTLPALEANAGSPRKESEE